MIRAVLFLGLVSLAACGADGAPVRPTLDAGVSVSPSGISTGAAVGVKSGNVGLTIGL